MEYSEQIVWIGNVDSNMIYSSLTSSDIVWTGLILFKIFFHAKRLNSSLALSIANGYKLALSGHTTGNSGQRMVTHYRVYMLVLVL